MNSGRKFWLTSRVLHMSVVQLAEPFLNQIGTEVRGHDDYRITEVDRSPLPVGETPVVEYLQQNVEHIRVRFSTSSSRMTE